MRRTVGVALLLASLLAPQVRAQVPAPVGGDMTNTTVKATGATAAIKQGDRAARVFSPLDFGAKGDGTTDDTVAVQAAIDAAGNAGAALEWDMNHLYYVSGTLTVTKPFNFRGPLQYGPWTTTPSDSNYGFCPWGIKASNSGGASHTLFNISAISGTFGPLCMQMMDNNGADNATAGAAIYVNPPSSSTYVTGIYIDRPTIINPYVGIAFDGNGVIAGGCCGKGTTQTANIFSPMIISPAAFGIEVGKNTTAAGTVSITVEGGTQVICRNATSQANATAVAVHDGAIDMRNGTNGPLGCHSGLVMDPGDIAGSGQNAQVVMQGVVCDQCGLVGLLMQPKTANGVISLSSFGQCWVTPANGTTPAVNITNPNGGNIYGIKFVGCDFHTFGNSTQPLVEVISTSTAGGSIGSISFTGNGFMCWGGNCSRGLLYLYASEANSTRDIVVTGNSFEIAPGVTAAAGVEIEDSGSGHPSYITIVGNDFTEMTAPVKYTGALTTDTGPVLVGNSGIDDRLSVYASASGVLIQPYETIIQLTGTATVSSLEVPWAGRSVRIIGGTTALTLSPGGTYPFCVSTALGAGKIVTATWLPGATCWATSS